MADEALRELLAMVKRIWWLSTIVGGFLVVYVLVIGAATLVDSWGRLSRFWRDWQARRKRQRLNDSELYTEARKMAKGIIELLERWRYMEPPMIFDQFHESAEASRRHLSDTLRQFRTEFLPEVISLREEFLKRGISEPELNRSIERAVNTHQLQEIAVALLKMAEGLRR